ncbi:chromate transporter [Tuberibacillus sp. Marseille-P3662]|uniref:chromate transporter n=1 Tax=Tuberibacillus sp. Marseille-P3662 TaxID=1965358 RepID=UPI000A1CAADB|nr:chromate transporter [Tuberibacillus sp. Marseille-P3662]
MRLYNLFMAFLRVGLLGYGGGPGSIPLIHKEVVDKYEWMTDDEFGDVLALANTLPGPIATKMAGYIGWMVAKTWGMVVGVLATIVPTILLMILLLTFLAAFQEQPWVQGMTHAVIPVVGVMLAVLTWQFLQKAGQGLGWIKCLILAVVALLLIKMLGLHPAIIIGATLLYVLIKPSQSKKSSDERGETG